MSDIQEVTFDAPAQPERKAKKPRKYTKRKAATTAAEPASKVAFPGLTKLACADTCNAKGCAISGKPYCAHPTKGGLQAADQSDNAALKRMQTARNQLDLKIDPDRFK